MSLEITVTEALRLKNEISQCINTLNRKTNYCSLGTTKESGVEISVNNEEKFTSLILKLKSALLMSQEINNVISDFNKNHQIDVKVRSMQNSKLLLNVYTNVLPKTKNTKTTRFENVGNDRKSISVEFTSDISSTEIKKLIFEEKQKIRDLQTNIETLNQNYIGLSFDYNDIESLLID